MSSDTPTAGAADNVARYSLTFVNNSSQNGAACVFQRDPNLGVPNAMPLAWFARWAGPSTRVNFQWTTDYSFVWGQVGQLVPGVTFMSAQMWPADLSTRNMVTFSTAGGNIGFQNPTQGPSPGSLYINEAPTVFPNMAAVGIGMSGSATFVAQAMPNMMLVFTPHPQYWIAFGNFEQGQVLDPYQITNAAQIAFPPGVYSVTATLNQDNTWTIQPNNGVNEQ
jgi:hypothetical protein